MARTLPLVGSTRTTARRGYGYRVGAFPYFLGCCASLEVIPPMIRPGEEVHYVALLDSLGETLTTVPLDSPLKCPDGAQNVEVKINLNLTLPAKGSR
jgi:hypothetical protein